MWLAALEVACLVAVAVFGITQVMVPAARGRLLFPLLRRERALRQELADAAQVAEEARLEELVRRARRGDAGFSSEKKEV